MQRICDYLNKLCIPVVLSEIEEYAGEGSIGRPHFARWLQEHGYVASRKEAFLAHPGLLKFGRKNQESLIRSLKAAGLDGIECFYSKHEKKQEEYYLRLAKEYDLKVSCGSDFHGEKVKQGIELGMHMTF